MRSWLRRTSSALIVASAIVAASATAAQAVTVYATPGGTSTGDCLTEAPACEITYATHHAGTTEVIVLPGTYALGGGALLIPTGGDVPGQAASPTKPLITSSSSSNAAVDMTLPNARLADVEVEKLGGVPFAVRNGFAVNVIERVFAHSGQLLANACNISAGTVRDSVCWASASGGAGLGAAVNSGAVHNIVLRNVTAVGSTAGGGGFGISYSADAAGVDLQ